MQIDDFHELLTRDEPVLDELAPYVVGSKLGPMLKHPLVFVVFGFNPKKAGLYNRQFREKLKYVQEAEAEGKYSRAMIMYERPHRLEYLSKIAGKLSDQEYWELLGFVITDSENLWQYAGLLKVMLAMPRPGRESMMTEEEQEALAKLPDVLQIWRGCRWQNRNGLSWTLNKDRAIWFAMRFNRKHDKPRLHSGTVEKSHVIAHFSGRGEDEILVLPDRIKNKQLDLI